MILVVVDLLFKRLSILLNLQVRQETEVPVVEEAHVCLEDVDMSWIQDLSDELFVGIEELIEPSTPPAAQGGHPGDS